MKTQEQRLEYQREYQRKYYANRTEERDRKMREHNKERASRWILQDGEAHGDSSIAAVRTHKEVAAILGCSAERVRQLERQAFWKLRRSHWLREHWEEFKGM